MDRTFQLHLLQFQFPTHTHTQREIIDILKSQNRMCLDNVLWRFGQVKRSTIPIIVGNRWFETIKCKCDHRQSCY